MANSIPAGTLGLSGGRPPQLTQDLKAQLPSVEYNISQGLIKGCLVCQKTENLSRCKACAVVRYCGAEHQKLDWPNHMKNCKALKTKRKNLIKEECVMCAMVGEQVFVNSKGLFWKNPETVQYMAARFKVAEELMKINTDLAVEEALEHLMESCVLNRADNQGLRYLVPAQMIRLRRDQEAYGEFALRHFVYWDNNIETYEQITSSGGLPRVTMTSTTHHCHSWRRRTRMYTRVPMASSARCS